MNGSQVDSAQQRANDRGIVAPVWHTAVVLFLTLGLSFIGASTSSLPGIAAYGRAPGYILVMLFEWATVAFIWYGVSRRGIRIADLVAGKWAGPAQVFRDLAIAIGFVAICGVGLLAGLSYLLKATPNAALRNMFPHGPTEIVLYLMLTLTAGFCEEVIFRGYFQRQFAALTGSTAAGIVLQGIVFGAAHGYQGWKFMLLIAVYGITFGLLAAWRRSLRPGMLAHFLQDAIGGLAGPHLG